jgi:hypothetical protein
MLPTRTDQTYLRVCQSVSASGVATAELIALNRVEESWNGAKKKVKKSVSLFTSWKKEPEVLMKMKGGREPTL